MNASPLYRSYQNDFSNLRPQEAKSTKASAIQIGNPVSYNKAVNELKHFNGIVEAVTENELMDWKAQIDLNIEVTMKIFQIYVFLLVN